MNRMHGDRQGDAVTASVRSCRKRLCCDLVQPSPVLGFSGPNAMLWNGAFLVQVCPRLTESGTLRIRWGWSLLIWPTSPGEHLEGSSGMGVTFAKVTVSIRGNFLVPLGNELASLCLLVNFTFISIHCSSLCSLGPQRTFVHNRRIKVFEDSYPVTQVRVLTSPLTRMAF